MIDTCTWKQEGQDSIHGKQRRVLNEVPMKSGTTELRCTVCGATKERGKKKEETK